MEKPTDIGSPQEPSRRAGLPTAVLDYAGPPEGRQLTTTEVLAKFLFIVAGVVLTAISTLAALGFLVGTVDLAAERGNPVAVIACSLGSVAFGLLATTALRDVGKACRRLVAPGRALPPPSSRRRPRDG